MGFYRINPNAVAVNHSDELLHQLECKACPLNEIKTNRNPHIPAQGAESPKVYILGEAPGADEDRNNTIFTGDSGELLRTHIPKEWLKYIRWNNVVRCFPGDVNVIIPSALKKLYRYNFSGPLTIITTKLGNKLPCTPHHPILTSKGWVFAYQLKEGDKIINYGSRDEWMSGSYPNKQYKPISLEKLFQAHSLNRNSEWVIGSGLNFHGDRPTGKIDIVTLKRQLRGKTNSSLTQFSGQWDFIFPNLESFTLERSGSSFPNAGKSKIISQPGATTKPLSPLLRGHTLGQNFHLFGGSSDANPISFEKRSYSRFDPKLFSELLAAFPQNIALAYPLRVLRSPQRTFTTTNNYSFRPKDFPDPINGGAELLRDLIKTVPGIVQFDNITRIDVRHYDGFLYNLETEDGWFIAENHIVSNTRPPKNRDPSRVEIECCRPSVERDIVESKPLAIFGFGAFPLHWVSKRDGIAMWRGRRFPVNIKGHECWYYAFVHPAWLYRMKEGKRNMSHRHIATEPERAFVFDLKRAFAEIDDLPEPVVHTQEVAEYGVEIITGKKSGDLERLAKYLEWAKKQKIKGFDWETNAIRPYYKHSKLLTAAVGTNELSFSWAIDHRGAGWSQRQRGKVVELTIDFLRNDEGTKAVHALGFEQEWAGVILDRKLLRASRWDDSMTQAHIIDERLNKNKGKQQGPLSLDWLCFQYFGISIKSISVLDRANLDNEPVEDVCRYNGIDAKYHCLLFQAQDEVIRREGLLKQYKMMRRRVPTCVLTQIKGLPVNPKVTKHLDKKYQIIIDESKEQIAEIPEVHEFKKRYKATFNPLSGDDVELMMREILKRKEGFKIDRETGKEKYSTDEEVLKKIGHPICPLILRLRKANKRSSTYLYRDLWPDGMLHSTFNTVFTETWRLSSDGPNLQNLPKRVEENKEVRAQIVAPPGHSIVAPDYGQIEARVIAMITKDPVFCKALWERYDVHGDEARRLALCYPKRIGGKKFIDDKDVIKKLRDAVKNKWTFPLFFGASLNRVSDEMEIPVSDLEAEYNRFQKTFSGVFDWHEELQGFYQKHGYVETLNGVRRRAPLSHNKVINTPVQGTAAEIVMDGMNRISELADDMNDWYLQPNIQIHDDLTFILPDNKIDYYAEKIITTMLDCPYDFINVPLTIEMSVGPDLLNMEEVLKASSDDWKVRRK